MMKRFSVIFAVCANVGYAATCGSSCKKNVVCEKSSYGSQPYTICNSGYVVEIVRAVYGRIVGGTYCGTSKRCGGSKDLTRNAEAACNYKNYCKFVGTNNYQGDPCRVNKYTAIEYNCIKTAKWSTWAYSGCSKTCGAGSQTKIRTCKDYRSGGNKCTGSSSTTQKLTVKCNTMACPYWQSWGSYGSCSKPCGKGSRTKTRSCKNYSSSNKCSGSTSSTQQQTADCNTHTCAGWQSWGSYGSCSKSCGTGSRTKQRSCKYYSSSNKCSGSTSSTQQLTVSCNKHSCAYWQSWGSYGSCSKSCGKGSRTKTRSCKNYSSSNKCSGSTSSTQRQTAECNTHGCAYWQSWGSYSSCSKTCGKGFWTKHRSCKNWSSSNKCSGSTTSTQLQSADCNTHGCAYWGSWGSYGSCSETCGKGSMTKQRSCNNYSASNKCSGSTSSTQPLTTDCNTHDCAYWQSWGSYGSCSKSCGKGSRTKTRSCENYSSSNTCIGSTSATEEHKLDCNTQRCVPSPCPSTACWTHDIMNNKCDLIPSCVSLTCHSDKMAIGFSYGVFGNHADSSAASDVDGDQSNLYTKEVLLTDAAMTFPDADNIAFATRVEVRGNDSTRTRTDTADNRVELDGTNLAIITTPLGVGVSFSCSYPTTFEVSSETFEVQDISISGATTGTGDLTSTMTMVAGDSATPTVLGDDVNVATTWSLAIVGASHHYKKCTVTQGTTAVDVLKDACVSNTLGASLVSNMDSAKIEMKFKSFVIKGESATTQTVSCDIQICAGDDSCVRDDAVTTCADLTPLQYSYQ